MILSQQCILLHSFRFVHNTDHWNIFKRDSLKVHLQQRPRFHIGMSKDSNRKILEQRKGSFSLVLERPFYPFPIQQLCLMSNLDILLNRGRVPIVTWNKTILVSNLQTCSKDGGNSGFVMYSPKFIAFQGWNLHEGQNGNVNSKVQKNILSPLISQLACIFSEEESGDVEWAHGSFPLEEYTILRHCIVPRESYITITFLV